MFNKHVFCEFNITDLQFYIATCRQSPKVKESELTEVE